MRLYYLRTLFVIFLLTCWCRAANVQIAGHYDAVKAENGLIIAWQMASEDRTTQQVRIYDTGGKFLVGVAPLRLVSEAKRATVHDVSAVPGRLIAIAAVYRKSEDSVPAASLLYFDFRGNLLLALALDPSREAARLTIDDESNVWTLLEGVGDRNPADEPMVVGYDASGNVLKEISRRSQFPYHAVELRDSDPVGAVGFGHSSDSVWFWLPGSTDLVTFGISSSLLERSITGLPNRSAREIPEKVLLTDKGTLLVEIRSSRDERDPGQINFLSKPPATNQWKPFRSPCSSCRLIGTDGNQALFMRAQQGGIQIYAASMPE